MILLRKLASDLFALSYAEVQAKGYAAVSEEDGPEFIDNSNFKVEKVSEGFEVRKCGNMSLATDFDCTKCQVVSDSRKAS